MTPRHHHQTDLLFFNENLIYQDWLDIASIPLNFLSLHHQIGVFFLHRSSTHVYSLVYLNIHATKNAQASLQRQQQGQFKMRNTANHHSTQADQYCMYSGIQGFTVFLQRQLSAWRCTALTVTGLQLHHQFIHGRGQTQNGGR